MDKIAVLIPCYNESKTIKKVVEDFKRLSEIVGSDSMGWRYDPIFLSDTYTVQRHLKEQAQQ